MKKENQARAESSGTIPTNQPQTESVPALNASAFIDLETAVQKAEGLLLLLVGRITDEHEGSVTLTQSAEVGIINLSAGVVKELNQAFSDSFDLCASKSARKGGAR